jgi:hypothetical protein
MSSSPSASDPAAPKMEVVKGLHFATWDEKNGLGEFEPAMLPVLDGKVTADKVKAPKRSAEVDAGHKALASKTMKLDVPALPPLPQDVAIKQFSKLIAAGLTAEQAEKAMGIAQMEDPKSEDPKSKSTTDKYHPFKDAPLAGGRVVEIGQQPEKGKYKFAKFRIDENYNFETGNITFENRDAQLTDYDAWSFKRLKVGEPDTPEYVDQNGKRRKRFVFSGPIATLPELNLAVRMLNRDSNQSPKLSLEDARELETDENGVIDLYEASKPVYSTQVCSFSGFRAYWFDNHFTSLSNQPVTYKSFSLAKQKSERSRARGNHPEKDFFTMQLPSRRSHYLEIATELAMEMNNMKKLPFPDEVQE